MRKNKQKVLLVVDLQPSFKDFAPEEYKKILDYVNENRYMYDRVIATRFVNYSGSPFEEYKVTKEFKDKEDLEFIPTEEIIDRSTYGILYTWSNPLNPFKDDVTVVGFGSDSSILCVAMELFNCRYSFQVLKDYIYTINKREKHEVGISLLKQNIGRALV